MPPWFADPKYGHFANDRTLSEAEIDTLVAWADNGALEGEPKDAPPRGRFTDGWNIKPDMIIEMPKAFHVAATGHHQLSEHPGEGHFPQDIGLRRRDAPRQSEGRASWRGHGPAAGIDVDGEGRSRRSVRAGDAREGWAASEARATDCWVSTIPGWARKTSTWMARPSSFPRVRTSCSISTTPPSERHRRTGPRSDWCSPRILRRSAIGCRRGTPAAFNLAIPAGDSNAEVVSEVTVGAGRRQAGLHPAAHAPARQGLRAAR